MNKRQDLSESNALPITAVLEHLSGPSIGLQTLLHSDHIYVSLTPKRFLSIASTPTGGGTADTLVVRLVRSDGTYRLEAIGENPIWVNGRDPPPKSWST